MAISGHTFKRHLTMNKKKQDKEAQEKLGCCPCMFSAYQRYKKNLDVK